ncbi:MAG: peptidoglycan recognition family protein [Phormidesmis sp.]
MRRSWLVWAASIVAFLLTVAVIVSTGPVSDTPPISNNQSRKQSIFAAKAENAGISATIESGSIADERITDSGIANKLPIGNSVQSSAKSNVQDTVAVESSSGTSSGTSSGEVAISTTKSATGYQPQEVLRLADPSNYGERFAVDVNGILASNDFIVVLHETVGSASSALNLFARYHPRDEDQVSYHTLIGLDGTVYYVVPPEQRAFGAGDSSFRTAAGEETVTTNPGFPSSVNNFAYHISLETPPDGQNNNSGRHSGYTEAQYQSLAWLLARTTVPDYRITTHKAVDRSGSRSDPRSFEPTRLFNFLHQYPSRSAYSY